MNDEETDEATANITSVEEILTELLTLAYGQIKDEEMLNILKQLENYRKLLSECILEEAPYIMPLNMKRLKQSVKEGFVAFKRCKDVVSQEEEKKAVSEAFMRENWDYDICCSCLNGRRINLYWEQNCKKRKCFIVFFFFFFLSYIIPLLLLLFYLFHAVTPLFSSSSTFYRAGLVRNTSREVWEPFLHVVGFSILHLDQRPVSSILYCIWRNHRDLPPPISTLTSTHVGVWGVSRNRPRVIWRMRKGCILFKDSSSSTSCHHCSSASCHHGWS